MLGWLQPLLFPFEPDLSGLKQLLFPLQPSRDSLKRMRPGMNPEAFRPQPHSLFLEPLQPRLQPEEHGDLCPPHPNEDRRCPAPGIVPRRSPAAIQIPGQVMAEGDARLVGEHRRCVRNAHCTGIPGRPDLFPPRSFDSELHVPPHRPRKEPLPTPNDGNRRD